MKRRLTMLAFLAVCAAASIAWFWPKRGNEDRHDHFAPRAMKMPDVATPPEPTTPDDSGPPYKLFSGPWARAWAENLRESEQYRLAASGWQWPLALTAPADRESGFPAETAIYLDLVDGGCRKGRLARDGDVESCTFVLRATIATWTQVLQGEKRIVSSILSGDVEVERGSLLTLLRYTTAANKMVDLAAEIDTVYPGDH